MISSFPTDSYLFLTWDDDEQREWPATRFPEYTDEHLTQFVDRLWAMSNGDLASSLPLLSNAGLYTLVVVLARAAGAGPGSWDADRRICDQLQAATPALLAELRRRASLAMGDDPTGPIRRGRLLQLVGAFTPLSQLGGTTRQRQKMQGACPFCDEPASLQISLPGVTWRCFECGQSGGVHEFAECLLTRVREGSVAQEQRRSTRLGTGPVPS